MAEARTPEQVEEAARRERWAALPPRIRPEEMSSAQPESHVPLPEDPHREALYAGG